MPGVTGLQPLNYHLDVAGRLARLEPEGWRAFATAGERAELGGLHAELARTAYRLDPQSHPRVGAAMAAAVAALGVEVPVTVHQLEGERQANAALLHHRQEVVVTLSGDLLERLTDPELAALFGHELAHHRLWTLDGGRFGTADRMLNALAADARTPEPFLETARRWSLATELFADRGALAACGDLQVTVACLVKVATGLREVDAAGYLRQADVADPAAGSRGWTHPETVLRAWALQHWDTNRTDEQAATLLRPRIRPGRPDHDRPDHDRPDHDLPDPGFPDLECLDLADQEVLEQLTRRMVGAFLELGGSSSDLVLAHARAFFPDLQASATPPSEPVPTAGASAAAAAVQVPDATRRYLGYVLLDLATVDPDLQEHGLTAAGELAGRLGFGELFTDLVRLELGDAPRSGRGGARTGAARSIGSTPGGRRRR